MLEQPPPWCQTSGLNQLLYIIQGVHLCRPWKIHADKLRHGLETFPLLSLSGAAVTKGDSRCGQYQVPGNPLGQWFSWRQNRQQAQSRVIGEQESFLAPKRHFSLQFRQRSGHLEDQLAIRLDLRDPSSGFLRYWDTLKDSRQSFSWERFSRKALSQTGC